jgi:hypothetical protein
MVDESVLIVECIRRSAAATREVEINAGGLPRWTGDRPISQPLGRDSIACSDQALPSGSRK